jgi:ParB-like chromosome segregation protein Spo0J
VFKDIISRDNGCPWGTSGQTSATWLNVPVVELPISELVATQPGLLLHALSDKAPQPVGGDIFPHVILWNGTYYLEDGHHRTVRARLSGQTTVKARLLNLDTVSKKTLQ